MELYRETQNVASGVGAVTLKEGGRGSPNPAPRPSLTDFRCDVDGAIKMIVADHMLVQFYLAYTYWDTEDPIEMEVYAQHILGSEACNMFAQCVGAEFLRRGLFPTYGKGGYFTNGGK